MILEYMTNGQNAYHIHKQDSQQIGLNFVEVSDDKVGKINWFMSKDM